MGESFVLWKYHPGCGRMDDRVQGGEETVFRFVGGLNRGNDCGWGVGRD